VLIAVLAIVRLHCASTEPFVDDADTNGSDDRCTGLTRPAEVDDTDGCVGPCVATAKVDVDAKAGGADTGTGGSRNSSIENDKSGRGSCTVAESVSSNMVAKSLLVSRSNEETLSIKSSSGAGGLISQNSRLCSNDDLAPLEAMIYDL